MAESVSETAELAERIGSAFAEADVDRFGALLAPDVRWGSDDHPRACRSRAEVLETFRRLLGEGARGEVTELAAGTKGVLCGLAVRWPGRPDRPAERTLFHVYLVRDGRVVQIRPCDDRDVAADLAGVERAGPPSLPPA
jgi:ketosteroid isomerase-like protein